jgi:mono/diheme cytochrome c family protein
MESRVRPIRCLLAAIVWAVALPVTAAGDVERGRILYESNCGSCHSESVHGRAKRVAREFEDVRNWVRRWSGNLKLGWTDDETEDVAVYLNSRYYKFACPPSTCRATGRIGRGPQGVASR